MDILTNFKEYACHSGILTDRNILTVRNIKILDNVIKDTFCDLAVLAGTAGFDSILHIFREMFIGFDTEFFDNLCKSAYFDFSHNRLLSLISYVFIIITYF